ncbi:carboxymuconolactone decarboxylase family protein [Xylanimonas ulmi]|uniref:AhpD family alkylhydroperoxidase n=1 Tax=Xylanimonas ulmi TaxID=228973 RepID=A0A4Q7M284_9MICO|nr:carboxymuconolactone decarboxylase family protein [Xylanibacterium ulmi]RZS60548.1 AhpD family alkylhydroperoxidase [Xylanibacterium ulmi]
MSYEPEVDATYAKVYQDETPDILQAFSAFGATVFAPEGRAIPLRYRELIAVGVAIASQCEPCIDHHSNAATDAGATSNELAEAAWVASMLRAGGAFAHGRLAFKYAGAHSHA